MNVPEPEYDFSTPLRVAALRTIGKEKMLVEYSSRTQHESMFLLMEMCAWLDRQTFFTSGHPVKEPPHGQHPLMSRRLPC